MEKPKVQIELGILEPARTSVQHLQRTLAYAEDPLAYLEKVLGPEILESRRPLLSIPELPIQNDTYGFGAYKERFEQHIAALFGKSHGLFFLTGVQAQGVACKIHCTQSGNPRAAWHVTSHLEGAEQKAVTSLFGIQRISLGSDFDSLPTVSEIETIASVAPEERPAMILLEIPNRALGCETYSFSELTRISRICKNAGIALHCDGARIWDIGPFYKSKEGKSLSDVAALFDSVYVSFYKGLGGSSGAMLLSNDVRFMLSARIWQRRAGGHLYTAMYQLIDCERGFNEKIGGFEGKWMKTRAIVEGITRATEKYQKDGRPIISFRTNSPTCCFALFHLYGYSTTEWQTARDRVLEKTGVKVFTPLSESGGANQKTFDDILKEKWMDYLKISENNGNEDTGAILPLVGQRTTPRGLHKTWYTIYSEELKSLDTRIYIDAWVNLCDELSSEAAEKQRS